MAKRSWPASRIARLELASLLLLFEVLVWFLSPQATAPVGAAVFLGLLGLLTIHVLFGSARLYPAAQFSHPGLEPLRKGRLGRESWRLGAPIYAVLLVAGAIGIYALGRLGTPTVPISDGAAVITRFGRYLVWAAVQTYLYFEFTRPRLLLALGPERPGTDHAVAMAILFAIVHLPNPYTMAGSAVAGFIWSLLYARFPNYVWVVLSHAVFGTCVQVFTNWPIRIGPAFWNSDYYAFRTALKQLAAFLAP